MRGNAQLLGPLSVHPGIALMIQEPVILSSTTNLLTINEEEDQLQLTQQAIWDGAQIPSTSAE